MVNDYCNEKRTLPQATATISLLKAKVNRSMVKDILKANCLHFSFGRRGYLKPRTLTNRDGVSNQEVRQWHQFLNAHLTLLVKVEVGMNQKE